MIISNGHLKILDNVFYYPGKMSDDWIINDPVRALIIEHLGDLKSYEHILIISAHGIRTDVLKSLLKENSHKKILMTYCGENIYVKNKVISYIYNGLHRLGIPNKIKDVVTLNPIASRLLYSNTPVQNKSYFKNLAEFDSAFNYLLTNDLELKKDNVFFAPYFYFFCRDVIPLFKKENDTEFGDKKKFCAFVVSNPSNPDRIEFFKQLSTYKKIDSFGKVLNNVQIEALPGEHYVSLLRYNHLLFKKYKFVIAFENSYAKGYITEKLINVLAGGSIPIYRGAADIGKYFNLNRIVDYNYYDRSYKKMIDKIIELDQDDLKYQQFIDQYHFADNILPPGYEDLGKRLATFIRRRLDI